MESEQADILTVVASFFEKHAIAYMLTGAWSVIYYGRPRASHDVDLVVDFYPKDLPTLLSALKQIESTYLFDAYAITNALEHKDLFQLIHKETFLKIDCWMLQDDPFDQSRFQRKQRIQAFGQKMWIASPEDTILQKLRWYKDAKIEKHIVDAAFVYQIQKKLDNHYISQWAKILGVTRYLKKLRDINLEMYI